jgi:anthranilate phosphoribosyltransferase
MRHEVLDPVELSLTPSTPQDLRGGDAQENAQVVRDLLQGSQDGRLAIVRQVVALNAAAALVAYDATTEGRFGSVELSVTERIAQALPLAFESIDSGAAWTILTRWAEVSTDLALH